MKKITLVITVLVLINSTIFSQENKQIISKKAVKIEIIDISGKKHEGYLRYADSVKVLFVKQDVKNIFSIDKEKIFKIKLSKKRGFGNAFASTLAGASAVIMIITLPMDTGMLPPIFVSAVFETIFGVPASLISGTVFRNNDKIGIDYIVDGEKGKYKNMIPVMKKYSINKIISDSIEISVLSPERHPVELKKIIQPPLFKSPISFKILHATSGFGYEFNNFKYQIGRNLATSDFDSGIDYSYVGMYFFYKYGLSISFNPNFRGYINYTGSTHTEVAAKRNNQDHVNYSLKANTFAVGATYVFEPINRSFLKRYEFSVSAGLAFSSVENSYYFHHTDLNVSGNSYGSDRFDLKNSLQAIQLGGNFDYYVSKSISLNFGIDANIMLPYQIPELKFALETGETGTTNNLKINLLTIHPTFGISVHL